MLTRDDFDFETTGDVSGRKQALWTTLIRKFFDEDVSCPLPLLFPVIDEDVSCPLLAFPCY